jgi:hypothetical protein
MLKRLSNGEFALAMLVASLFWIFVLVWATSYSPTDPEKEACYQAAAKSGRSTEECKSFWEKTTSDPVAMFTLVLAVSTIGLWSATIGLYFAGERQFRLGREEFLSTHRPKIIVHAVDVKRFPDVARAGASEIDKLGAILLCINRGRSPAVNVEIRGTTMVSSGVPDAKIMRPVIKAVESLESGIKIWIEINTERAVQEIRVSPQPMYFIGTISYFDKNGNRRETGFCYMFHPPVGGWMRVKAKTHDYAY